MREMRDAIDRLNVLGDHSPGCLWRYKTQDGAATGVRVLDDPTVLFNLTVWRSLEDLGRYVYRSDHAAFLRRRREWFVPATKEPVAMWWIAPGEHLSVEEAMTRFEQLWRDGPTAEAFTFKRAFGPGGQPSSSWRPDTGRG
jgi:hypothetical protein